MEKKPSLDDWGDFSGDFLKAEDIKEFPLKLAVASVDTDIFQNKPVLFIESEYKGRMRKLRINKTNQDILKKEGLTPIELKDKIIIFDKIMVRNPATKETVPSFIISSILDNAEPN